VNLYFRYEQSEDEFFRLIPVRYESLEVSNQIIAEQKSNKKKPAGISKSLDETKFKLVQCSEGNTEKPATFVLIPPSSDNTACIEKMLSHQDDVEDEPSGSNAGRVKHQRSRKRKRTADEYLKVVKVSRAKLTKESAKTKSKKLKSVPLKKSNKKNIQISIAEVDHDGNIIKSEVVESQEIVI
jgi:hypothetical protein